MPRQRRPSARGTRDSSGVLSGVTWATNPSGVSVDANGISTASGLVSLVELNYLNGAAGSAIGNATAAKLLVSGVSNWAGTTLTLTSGLSSIDAITVSVIDTVGSTQALYAVTSLINNTSGSCSASLRYSMGSAGSALAALAYAPGCSIAFMAFGS